MRSRIVVGPGGRHWFEELDPEAVVDKLLHEMSMPEGTWRELQAHLSKALLQPWHADLPHWEVQIIRGLHRSEDLPGDTALFFRLDHALGDGFALKNWLMSLTDEVNPNSSKNRWTASTDHLPQLLAAAAAPPAGVAVCAPAKPLLDSLKGASLAFLAILKVVVLQVLLLLPALWVALVESELTDTDTRIKWDDKKHSKTMRKEIRVTGEYSLGSIRALAQVTCASFRL